MQAVLLAAGVGSRLGSATARTPKALVAIAGVPILERILRKLHDARIDEVICVTGHYADQVEDHVGRVRKRPPVRFVHNDQYDRTNNIVSVALTFGHWNGSVMICDGDLLVCGQALDRLVASRGNAMAVDTSRTFDEADLKAELRDGRVWHLDKELPRERFGGEALGLSRWAPEGAALLRAAVTRALERGRTDLWYPYAIRDVAKQARVEPLALGDGDWVEVDHPEDLDAARRGAARAPAWLA